MLLCLGKTFNKQKTEKENNFPFGLENLRLTIQNLRKFWPQWKYLSEGPYSSPILKILNTENFESVIKIHTNTHSLRY